MSEFERLKKEIKANEALRELAMEKLRSICHHPNLKHVDFRGDGG